MSWAEVKKINSDMSTPLDELFKNSFGVIGTDDILKVVAESSTYTGGSYAKVIDVPGTIKITGDLYGERIGSAEVIIYVNDTQIGSHHNTYSDIDLATSFSQAVTLKKGDVLRIDYERKASASGNVYIKKLYIRGMITVGAGLF